MKSNEKRLTALVTGASSGIGEAMARELAYIGHDIVLVSENRPELIRVRKDISTSCPVSVTVFVIDLSKTDAAEKLYLSCSKKKLQVDILINCAGIFVNADKERSSIDAVEKIINIHVQAVTKLCFLFGREMMRREKGYIMNVSSIASHFLDPASLTYGPTKRYILSFTEALHNDWKEHNIKVTCLLPGGVRTNFFRANDVYVPAIITSFLYPADKCARAGINAMLKGKRKKIPGIAAKVQLMYLRLMGVSLLYSLLKKSYYFLKMKAGSS